MKLSSLKGYLVYKRWLEKEEIVEEKKTHSQGRRMFLRLEMSELDGLFIVFTVITIFLSLMPDPYAKPSDQTLTHCINVENKGNDPQDQ